jgi:hypothetical protein
MPREPARIRDITPKNYGIGVLWNDREHTDNIAIRQWNSKSTLIIWDLYGVPRAMLFNPLNRDTRIRGDRRHSPCQF